MFNDCFPTSWDSISRGHSEKYKQAYVAVFSKNYAASTRCLQKLAAIAAECINSPTHLFLPIFFQVDPSHVRNSLFTVEENIQQLGLNLDKVETLLNQRHDLILRQERDQRQVLHQIVDIVNDYCVERPAGYFVFLSLRDYDTTIAMEKDKSGQIETVGVGYDHVEKLEKLLDLGSMDVVRAVGISGMGGVGKTALVGDVFNRISHLFDSTCFLTNPEQCGPPGLEDVLLRITLQKEYLPPIENIESSLRFHRVLIVFDDVDDWKPLYNYLTRRCEWFGGGSRIIVTSRDEGVLRNLGVDEIHKVELLNMVESRRLFCKTAFKCGHSMRDYEEMMWDALKYADGLPLAIKSVGSLLRDRSVSEWQTELAKLQTVPDSSVYKVLKKSIDQLKDEGKDIFLDIACCFAGEKTDYVKDILNSQILDPEIVEKKISILIDKSLISISEQKVKMHYMLQQMGKQIVQEESSEPGARSRIWDHEDFHQIMEKDTGTKHVKVIALSHQEYPQGTSLNVECLSKMIGLRVLIFHNMNVNFSGSLNNLSCNLRYFLWHKYPFTSLPSSFEPTHLMQLILPDSYITQLWRGKQIHLWRLKRLDLRGSKNLIVTQDFKFYTSLETLDLEGCSSLLRLHTSIVLCEGLKYLNLKNCTSLISIPNKLFGQGSLEFLNLAGCSKFVKYFAKVVPIRLDVMPARTSSAYQCERGCEKA